MNQLHENPTVLGTIGGTLLAVYGNGDLCGPLQTILSAAIGATVSFMVSLLLKTIFQRRR